MKSLFYILAALTFLFSTLNGQSFICVECEKKIETDYIIVEGNSYHHEHFKCAECKKPIEGEYTKSENKFFHQKCYFNEVLPKCDVCLKPLNGEFYQDIYEKKYHKYDLDEFQHCDNCNRLAAPKISNGGRQLDDDRYLCNICNRNALRSEGQYQRLLTGVSNRLKNLGVNISSIPISITPVNQKKLNTISNRSGEDRIRGFCKITSEHFTSGGKTKVVKNYSIYVLDNLPSIYSESTIAHELMHIWLHENTNDNHEESLEEGSCHYISYLYLKTVRSKEAEWITKLMMNDQNIIYGGGFRKVYSQFHEKPLTELLNFLKKEKQL